MNLVALALTDPVAARDRTRREIDETESPRDRALAGQALGIALRPLGPADDSVEALRAALEAAQATGDAALTAEVRLSLSGSLATAGHPDEAMAAAVTAERDLPEALKPRAWAQRASFVARTGAFAGAIDQFGRAELALRQHGDRQWLARLHNNRALVHAYSGKLAQAERDLRAGLDLYEGLGFTSSAAETKHNLGWIRSQRGDLVGALDLYSEAEATFASIRYPLNALLIDKVETLVFARLTREAVDSAARAVETVASDAAAIDVPEAWLMYARAALTAHRPDLAADAAGVALAQFEAVQAQGWAEVARLAMLEAKSHSAIGDIDRVLKAAHSAREEGWYPSAVGGYLLGARLAALAGDDETAVAALETSDELISPFDMPAVLRTQRFAIEAVVHWEAGRRRETADAASRALETLHDYRTSIAATDLRAGTAVLAEDATQLLVEVLTETDRLPELVEKIDQGRAASTNPPPVIAPADPEVAPVLNELRELAGEVGGPAEDFDRIAGRMREVESRLDTDAAVPVRSSGLDLDVLDDVTVLSLVVGRQDIVTLHAVSGALEVSKRTPVADLFRRLDEIRALLATASEDLAALEDLLDGVERMLLPTDLPRDRTIVISPPASMVSFPWTLLPSLRGSAVCIAPRLSSFAALERTPTRRTGSALLAAGPGVETAGRELVGIEPDYDDARVLVGRQATPDAVLDGLRANDVAHIACHARFRADNPLFSSLELATGPLHVHQLQGLDTLPPLIVLASCDSAAVAPTGTDFTGFLSVLLGLGARTVIAATTAVPDIGETADLMIAFHAALSGGERPADALARARRAAVGPDVASLATHTFQCFGWG